MKKIKIGNGYLIICISLIMLILGMFYVSMDILMKGTNAAFGNVTGTLTVPNNIKYISNYPDVSLEEQISSDQGKKDYEILNNMFIVPEGYMFSGWNTDASGNGNSYNENDTIYITEDINLYAQWSVIEEDFDIAYGDVNLNGVIDNDDLVLVEGYVSNNIILEGIALRNADVNQDGKVDLVDVDIIRQVLLGTDGYVGFLPNEPILKDTIYDGNNEENDNTTDDKSEIENGSSGNVGSNSSSNSGSNSSGGTNSKPSGNTASKPSSNSGNNDNNVSSGDNINVDNDGEIKLPAIEYYEFRYFVDDIVYFVTSCDNIIDGTCDLVLPDKLPVKDGYSFLGWSLVSDCSGDTIVTNSVIVSGNRDYYACFTKNQEKVIKKNNFVTYILVVLIWGIASMGIYRIIIDYKNKKNDD